MPLLRAYSIFICHAWAYSWEYDKVVEFLDSHPSFRWVNQSVPEHDPLDNDEKLEYELRNQIRPSDVVLIPAGMYAAHSTWIGWELRFCRRIGKPIVGIHPWGSVRTPVVVQNAAWEMVGWNRYSIVDAVRRNAAR